MKPRVVLSLPVLLAALVSAASCQPKPSPLTTPAADVPAPDSFKVEFTTSQGPVTMMAYRKWAPHGVDRFYYLVTNHYYDGNRFFRVLPGFIVQWGIHGNPAINRVWKDRTIPDDPPAQSNLPGTVTFATGGPNTRTTQLFVNTRDNRRLDAMGFTPIGKVIDGMFVFDRLFSSYGEGPPQGTGPDQDKLQDEGDAYVERRFPKLDSITRARVVQ